MSGHKSDPTYLPSDPIPGWTGTLVFGIAAGAWAHSREQSKKKTKKQLESEFEEKRRRSGARSAGFDDDDDDFD